LHEISFESRILEAQKIKRKRVKISIFPQADLALIDWKSRRATNLERRRRCGGGGFRAAECACCHQAEEGKEGDDLLFSLFHELDAET